MIAVVLAAELAYSSRGLHMRLLAGLILTISTLVSASPEPARIVLSLQKGDSGKLAIRVENASPAAVALAADTYLVLLSDRSEEPQRAAYWALLTVEGLPTASRPMRLEGRKRSMLLLDPGSLLWSPDRAGTSVEQPLGRAVPPGEYRLQVQIVDGSGAWWRSGELPVRISRRRPNVLDVGEIAHR